MTIEELEALCREAARDLLGREVRPLPAAVVVPLAHATRVLTLPGFPADDVERYDVLHRLADEVMRPSNAPAYGFVAEATLSAEDGSDVVVVAFGARGQRPRVTAAPVEEGVLGEWFPAEDLDPTAMPFLQPLQDAANAAT